MNDRDEKIISKIEKLIALFGSSNENEAKAAMLKAQELMAKYEIDREQVGEANSEERNVVGYTSDSFRDDWVQMLSLVIADNFRSRVVTLSRYGSRGAFRIRFYGFEEDALICINIFNYAVKVIRRRMATLRAIYNDAGRDFGRNEKMNYVNGFCSGLRRNFEEQKRQSEQFALALVTPAAVVEFVENIPGIEEAEQRRYERERRDGLLRRVGYSDGMEFRNAGDKERLDYGF